MSYHPEQDRLIKAALGEGIWQVGEKVTLASGRESNNHVDWEGLFKNPENPEDPMSEASLELTHAGELVVGALVERVEAHKPDVICGVPNGGQRFAVAIASRINEQRTGEPIHVARFYKGNDSGGKQRLLFEKASDAITIEGSRRLAVVEDATTTFGSLINLLKLIAKERDMRHATFIEAIHRRGRNEIERHAEVKVPINWLIDMQIPDMVTKRSPVYKKWSHLAKGSL